MLITAAVAVFECLRQRRIKNCSHCEALTSLTGILAGCNVGLFFVCFFWDKTQEQVAFKGAPGCNKPSS